MKENTHWIPPVSAVESTSMQSGSPEVKTPLPSPGMTPTGQNRERPSPQIPDHEIIRCIGRGSYGEVWLARNIMKTYRAVKVVHRDSFEDDRPYDREFDGIRKFEPISRTEGQVDILQVGRNDAVGYFYYVMELADDEESGQTIDPATYVPKTLRSEIKKCGRIPVERCLEIGLSLINALDHLHKNGLVHRDIKPSNIIFVNGVPKLADIGLVTGTDATKSFVGTEGYYPPEGPGTPQADVFSLGKVLYEMSTGRNRLDYPELPTAVGSFPDQPMFLELNSVVSKGCRADYRQRYASAKELREDLLVLLSGKSVQRFIKLERAWLRVKRAWPFAGLLFLGALIWVQSWRNDLAQEENNHRIELEQGEGIRARARYEKARAEDKQRRLLQQIQNIRLQARFGDWSSNAWQLASDAAGFPLNRPEVRDQAVAILGGLDARLLTNFTAVGASSVAFDSKGHRLLLSGLGDADRAGLWDGTANLLTNLEATGAGPVGFLPDGTPIQLLPTARGALALWNAEKHQAIREFTVPGMNPSSSGFKLLAMTPGGSFIAAVFPADGQKQNLAVWDSRTGDLLFSESTVQPTAIALAPGGEAVAVGDSEGVIQVWSVPFKTNLATLKQRRMTIESLAFQQDYVRDGNDPEWLLAVGDAGGHVQVWEIGSGIVRSSCLGSQYEVFTVAFNPDGTILASAGRSEARLWDVATSRLLLILPASEFHNSIAFSPDGRRLAVGAGRGWGTTNSSVWELGHGRGIHTLRGLPSQVAQVRFSPDGTLVAALAHNWQAGIWEVASGRLRFALDVPKGLFQADNAAFCFSADRSRFAYSAGTNAVMWNAVTGRELDRWYLPPGYVDNMAFTGSNTLALFRVEDENGVNFAVEPRPKYRLVSRIRTLREKGRMDEVATVTTFDKGVFCATTPQDGRFFAVSGKNGSNGAIKSLVKIYDSSNGAEIGTVERAAISSDNLRLSADGGMLANHFDGTPTNGLFAMPGAAPLPRRLVSALALGPGLKYWAEARPEGRGCWIVDMESGRRLFSLGIDVANGMHWPQFSPDGRSFAWGNLDGTVSLCDLNEVLRRLAGLERDPKSDRIITTP